MPAKVTKLSNTAVREAAEHRKSISKAQESQDVRAEVAQDERGGPAFFRLATRARNALAGPSRPAEAHTYTEWLGGAKVAGIAAYDRALTGGDNAHVAKLHRSGDLDTAVRELTGGLSGVQSPALGLVLTVASISTLHKLGGVEGAGNPAPQALEAVVG